MVFNILEESADEHNGDMRAQKPLRRGERFMIDITLLLVDDEEEILENLIFDLEKDVRSIITASNGQEALYKIKNEKIDVVITDINMPKKNGLDFAKDARSFGYTLPIIFLTAHGDDNLVKKSLALGAFDFIDKPYSTDSIREILQEAEEESKKLQSRIVDKGIGESEFEKAYREMIGK